MSEATKRLHAKRRAAGLCLFCGRAADGKSLCKKHRRAKAKSRKRRRKARVRLGLCWHCYEPAAPGVKMCERHRAEACERARRCLAKRKSLDNAAAPVPSGTLRATSIATQSASPDT